MPSIARRYYVVSCDKMLRASRRERAIFSAHCFIYYRVCLLTLVDAPALPILFRYLSLLLPAPMSPHFAPDMPRFITFSTA
jgi:hypothetical protein